MQNCYVDEKNELVITASISSTSSDFDFYEGSWNIHNRKLKSRLCNCTEWLEFDAFQKMEIIINGLGNTDNFIAEFDGKPFEGRNIRLFNPLTRLWSMYWTDSTTGVLQPPTVGSFENGIGKFYCKDHFEKQDIIVEFIWDKTDLEKPVWSQAFSLDQGKTWETNWYMFMTRMEA